MKAQQEEFELLNIKYEMLKEEVNYLTDDLKSYNRLKGDINNIQVKDNPFTDKVTISKNDFEMLKGASLIGEYYKIQRDTLKTKNKGLLQTSLNNKKYNEEVLSYVNETCKTNYEPNQYAEAVQSLVDFTRKTVSTCAMIIDEIEKARHDNNELFATNQELGKNLQYYKKRARIREGQIENIRRQSDEYYDDYDM
ncbi:MAG: hypothetical protein RR623_06845 [Bacilli bacterium]|uniref:hypothetical protein n=1 Tax=Anaerorhabdus sp. TaxID=1872524 RepID=UPI002FCCA8AE